MTTSRPGTARLEDLVASAAGLTGKRPRTVLGITGCPGAGKSKLAERLTSELNESSQRTAYIPMDGFHLADATLQHLGRMQRKGAIDTFDGHGYLALLRRLHLELDHTVYAPGFDRTYEQPIAAAIAVEPDTEIVVTEGNYLLAGLEPWPQVRAELAAVWYCHVDDDVRRERLIARHVRFGKSPAQARQWVERVDEPNAHLIASTRERADAVIDMAQISL